jgi:hypothetical protein
MIYDFMAKIRNVQNKDVVNTNSLDEIVDEINPKFDQPLELKFVLPSLDNPGEFLVKSQASVSSMPALHDVELEAAIASFQAYLEEIAAAIEGEISKKDAFYNNTKTFKRLFDWA